MEITKLLLCAIGAIGFLFSVVSCASLSSSVSSSPIVIKKINSVNNLSSPPSVSPSSPSTPIDDQPVDNSFNSLNSDSLGARPSVSSGDSNLNSKPDHLGDYSPIRSPFASNFGKVRGGGSGGNSLGGSTPSSMLTSSFSSSFSPSKLFNSLFSSSTSSRVSSSFPVHSFALRPINRLLELFPHNDYSNDDSMPGRDNFPSKVFQRKRQPTSQHHGDKIHPDQHGNGLSSPFFYSSDHLYPDLTKQGSISRTPWFTNTFRGPFPPTRRSTIRSIVDRLFG